MNAHTWKLLFSGPSSKSLHAQTGLMLNCSSKFLEMVSGIHRIASSGTYNLGTAKPHPPQIKDEAVRRAKTRHFPILDLRGRGGLGFPF